jgi:DoxX-like family
MNPVIPLSALLVLVFAVLGGAKILALPQMRQLATEAGFSVDAYRRIGVLELAGAAGIAAGAAVPLLGRLAGAGLLLLLAGALATHVRNRDGLGKSAPAIVCALLVAGYLATLAR